MDKSFNDQELSDIMKEIEALEEDFKIEEEKIETSSKAAAPQKAVAASAPKAEATVVPLASTPVAKPAAAPDLKHAPMNSGSAGTSMSFKVSGDIKLDLQFEIGGKVVTLSVAETGLCIDMDGGATFTVPLTQGHASKKAA